MSYVRLRFHSPVQSHNQGSEVRLRGFRGHLFHIVTFLIYYYKARQKAKWAAIQAATMLADHKLIDTRTAMKNQDRSATLGRLAMKLLGVSTSLLSTNPRPSFCFGSLDT